MKGLLSILLAWGAPLMGQTVSGVVVNGVTGEPIPGATVALMDPRENPPHEARTDSAGAFRLENLSPADYVLFANHQGFEIPPFTPRTVNVEAGKDATVRVTLMPWPNLSGRVFDRDRRPVAKASVTAIPTHGSTPWPVTTDSEGRFTLKTLQPSRYTLLVSPPEGGDKAEQAPTYYPNGKDRADGQRIEVTAGPDRTGYDITLRGGPFFKVSGRVVDEHGDPAAGASVRVRNTDVLFAKVTADADGRFEFEGIPEMSGRVSAQWKRGAADVQGYLPLNISGHDVEQVELRVAPPVPLAGTVELDGKPAEPGMGYAVLEAVDGMGHVEGATNKAGFHFDDAYAGRYRLVYYPGAGARQFYLDAVLMGDRDMTLQEFDLAPGMQPVRAILKSKGGRVQGTIEGSHAELMTVLVPREERLRYVPFIVQSLSRDGRVEFANVRPGDYYALTLDGLVWLVDLQDPVFLAAQLPHAVEVHVERGSTASVKIGAPQGR